MIVFCPTEALKIASSQMKIQPVPNMKYPRDVQILFPDLARVPTIAPNQSPDLPTILEEAKSKLVEYGFAWFYLPYSKKQEGSIWSKYKPFFYEYAEQLFGYCHVPKEHQAQVKQKDWMSEGKQRGNYTFHHDYANKKHY